MEKFCGGITVKSIDLNDINDHLTKKWMQAKRLSYLKLGDQLVTSLAEFNSQWHPAAVGNFFIKFRAPYVKALCSHEVILYFDIQKVWFFDGEDFTV